VRSGGFAYGTRGREIRLKQQKSAGGAASRLISLPDLYLYYRSGGPLCTCRSGAPNHASFRLRLTASNSAPRAML
jgi:hypothetical protein